MCAPSWGLRSVSPLQSVIHQSPVPGSIIANPWNTPCIQDWWNVPRERTGNVKLQEKKNGWENKNTSWLWHVFQLVVHIGTSGSAGKALMYRGLPTGAQNLFRPGAETYQQVDGAAHAVVAAVLTHHGAVVQQPNQEALHQGHKVLHLRLQRRLFSDTVQQAGTQRSRRQSMCTCVFQSVATLTEKQRIFTRLIWLQWKIAREEQTAFLRLQIGRDVTKANISRMTLIRNRCMTAILKSYSVPSKCPSLKCITIIHKILSMLYRVRNMFG